jgi:hypothetical protein
MDDIPSKERLLARRLARRVVNALVKAALAESNLHGREIYLDNLLTR